jgi:formylglycine-generating enzyme required for sulfatase activity
MSRPSNMTSFVPGRPQPRLSTHRWARSGNDCTVRAVQIIGALPMAFGELYPRPTDARLMIHDAGLDPGRFTLDGTSAYLMWAGVFVHLEPTGIEALLDQAVKQYEGNAVLERCLREVRHPQDAGADAQLWQLQVDADALNICANGVRFRYVPSATTWMGDDEGYEHEQPRHRVRHSAFFLQETPVTNNQFADFVQNSGYRTAAELGWEPLGLIDDMWVPCAGANWDAPEGEGSTITTRGDHPVVDVAWFDASIYCAWLARGTGFDVSLPTEAQWEYAASGPLGLTWPFGNVYGTTLANIDTGATSPVDHFPAGPFGLRDMAGNVYEWCDDWYAASWADAGHALGDPPSLDPRGPSQGQAKVLRGGSCFDIPQHCRGANRFYADPIRAAANWGFRCRLAITDDLDTRLHATPGWDTRAAAMTAEARDHE